MAELNLDGFGFNHFETVTGAKTLDEGDGGVVQNVTATATLTFPAVAVGRVYIVRVGADGKTVTLSPNAADKFMGAGLTSADDKDVVFTNQPAGSYIMVVGNADGWNIARLHGTITREA